MCSFVGVLGLFLLCAVLRRMTLITQAADSTVKIMPQSLIHIHPHK